MDNGCTKGSFVIDIPVKDFLLQDIFPNPNKQYMYVDGSRSIGDGVLFFYAGIKLFGVNKTVSSILFQFVFIDSNLRKLPLPKRIPHESSICFPTTIVFKF